MSDSSIMQASTLCVGGHSAEYVGQWSHLGHIVSADRDDKHDICCKLWYPSKADAFTWDVSD